MKTVVVVDDIKESSIRPKRITAHFVELLKADVRQFLKRRPKLVNVACPGCHGKKSDFAFEKLGMKYQSCRACLSVYMSPRPSPDTFEKFYRESKAIRFWNSKFMKDTNYERDMHIYLPRVDWLSMVVRRNFADKVTYGDVQPKYGPLLKRVADLKMFRALFGLDAGALSASALETLGYEPLGPGGTVDVISAFEVIERVYDTKAFVNSLNARIKNNGLLFLTTRAGSGFDLQALWENHENVLPFIHVNMLSVEGMEHLLRTAGYEILEMSTPGRLDVELVRQTCEAHPDTVLSRFVSYLIKHRSREAHNSFQEFLQQYRLSSHMRLVALKKS